MSAFNFLKETSKKFEEELQRVSNELFSAKLEESFEDAIAKKLRDLSLLKSKLKLLRAKPLSLTPQITTQEHDVDTTISEYGDTAAVGVFEQQVVRSAAQAAAIKKLVTAPDRMLDKEMLDRKRKIITSLSEYATQEATVQHLGEVLQEKEQQLEELRLEWEREVDAMRSTRVEARGGDIDTEDPMYKKLSLKVEKLQVMRRLMYKLAMCRSRGYDWLADTHRRVRTIALAREHHTVHMFTLDS